MTSSRQKLTDQIKALGKALPIQAPLGDFVHFNPLMHYESQPFKQATQEVFNKTGALCYLSADTYRKSYHKGRITEADLLAVFEEDSAIDSKQIMFSIADKNITQSDLYSLGLTQDIKDISYRKLLWKIEEDNALQQFQADTHHSKANQQFNKNPNKRATKKHISALWNASLAHFDLHKVPPHFNEFIDTSLIEIWNHINKKIEKSSDDDLEVFEQRLTTSEIIHERSDKIRRDLFAQVGKTITMRSVLKRLTDTDILVEEEPILFRQLSAWLDLGIACSHPSEQTQQSFYHFWKETALHDLNAIFEDLPAWKDYIKSLSDDPLETIENELMRIGIARKNWGEYLECLALEMPGWSGMFNWRDNYIQENSQNDHCAYEGVDKSVEMSDYLAVRLVTEHLFCRHITREHWNIDATLPNLRGYFKSNLNEFFVRYYTYNEQLPEYLQSISDQLLASTTGHIGQKKWHEIAHLMFTWLLINEYIIDTKAYTNAWRIFHLAQHLGLSSEELKQLKSEEIKSILALLTTLDDPNRTGYLWLCAYENNYKQGIYSALLNNHAQGTWANRETRPKAQLIFCMDDREESIRRHLETLSPEFETIGAAGVFGLPNNFKSLDAKKTIKLAQPVVIAVHQLHEVCDKSVDANHIKKHQSRYKKISAFKNLTSQGLRQSVLKSTLALPLLFPIGLSALVGRNFFPSRYQRFSSDIEKSLSSPVKTRIRYDADTIIDEPSAAQNQIGLSNTEKVEKVAAFLKLTGYTQGYSRLVVLIAHSSKQVNNPHILAYGCGACSGRFGGPNARTFVGIANEPAIRALLRKDHDIDIPSDCWLVAAEHDTTSDIIAWFDSDLIPDSHQQEYQHMQTQVTQAARLSAQERCRRFASVSDNVTDIQAYKHVQDRAASPSQPRAELGHQGCAAAFIGRRSMHQGVSWDRRIFMVSYDPFNDPEGEMLEAQLLGNGVVGVGIAMDYYFSSIQNGYLGSGNKATHNIAGNFGVMNGTSSDLKTGLARQMTELHEPMRLLVIVEAPLKTVEAIYQRQADIKNLIDNQWIIIAVKNPETAEIHEFKVGKGLVNI